MPICSYLVVPEEGAKERVETRLARMPGCDVSPAPNPGLLILVTESAGLEEEAELRSEVEAVAEIQALLFTFGEIDPETTLGDPVSVGRRKRNPERSRRRLPTVGPGDDR